jgi:tRNA-splicing endonuclease subunit Sen54
MHNVLSFERVHQPKGHTIGIYHPETNMCYAMNPKGPLFIKMGRVLPAHECPFGDDEFRGVRTWLHPEEALYLLERGTMDVRWPVAQDGDDEGEELGLPMSLQAGYAMFLGDEEAHAGGALTFERFTVYSGLKRAGYTVLRAPSWNSAGPALTAECFPPPLPRRTWQTGLFNSLSALKHFFLRDHPPPPQQQHEQGQERERQERGHEQGQEQERERESTNNKMQGVEERAGTTRARLGETTTATTTASQSNHNDDLPELLETLASLSIRS